MMAIIVALEKATKGDRRLDARIYCAIYKSAYPDETPERHLEHAKRAAPNYTTSVDVAFTLLPATAVNLNLFNYGGPEAWAFTWMDTAQLVGVEGAKSQIARLRSVSPSFNTREVRVLLEKSIAEHFQEFYCRRASTAALAVCSAALKGRAIAAIAPLMNEGPGG